MQIPELYKIYCTNPSIKTDTRIVQKGDLFFALKGDNFNGNHFAKQALDAGAAFAIIDETPDFSDERLIVTDDVLTTLQALAKYHREQFIPKNIPFIAITGSNGKTTTKELIHEVLSTTYKTYTTKGNFNNHIGIPLTILSVKKDAEIAVIEMGANHRKEIEGYCKYTLPTHGLITNCGKAHLEGFGGEEGVKKGKGELYDYLRNTNGTIFLFNDYDYLISMSRGIENIKTYGTVSAEVTGIAKKGSGYLDVAITTGADITSIHTHLIGDYNLPNVLAAVAIGKYFSVKDESIKNALENYLPGNSRSQLIEQGSNKIILDAYNANPSSMKAAIENFAKMTNGTKSDETNNNKILMLGAMMELGDESMAEHKGIIDLISAYQWGAVVLVGGDFVRIKHPYLQFENATQAKEWLANQNFTNSSILVKGSRSIKMEKVIE